MWHKNMGLISKVIDKMLMMLLPWFAFVLCTSNKDISYDDMSHLSHITKKWSNLFCQRKEKVE
jgi:hypothetical protein